MKLKYKKMIVLVSMCTMGIGLVTFSIVRPTSKEAANSNEPQIASFSVGNEDADNAEADDATQVADGTVDEAGNDSDINNKTIEVDELKKNEYKKINKLITKYLNAKLSKDASKFEGIVNDVSLIDVTDLERQTNYIESYNNIDVYTKKGPEEGSLIAYAYHEVKFTSIDTLAPAMNAFYLKANENGDYYIYLGSVDDETVAFLDEVRNSDEVMELIYNVNDKMKEAADSDSALAEFYLKLEETANQVAQNN